MANNFVNIDELLQQTTLRQYVDHYGFQTEIKQDSQEERIASPVPCEQCRGNESVVSVNWRKNVFTSHCYACEFKGKITKLLYGMKHGENVDKLTGERFKEILADVKQVAGYQESNNPTTPVSTPLPSPTVEVSETEAPVINVPLMRNEHEKIRALENLDQQFVYDADAMPAAAQKYLAERPYLTPERMKQWGIGYLPSSVKSMIRGRILYTLHNVRGEKLGYAGRDPGFDKKNTTWQNSDRKKAAPIKTKFPPGFQKGSFIYGAMAKRMKESGTRQQLLDAGLILCEGFNEAVLLDAYNIRAISLGFNRVANGQTEQLIRWSKTMAGGRITLFLDNNVEGHKGTMATLEKLAMHAHVRTVWTPDSFNGKYRDKEPEQLRREDLLELFEPISQDGVILKQIEESEGI